MVGTRTAGGAARRSVSSTALVGEAAALIWIAASSLDPFGMPESLVFVVNSARVVRHKDVGVAMVNWWNSPSSVDRKRAE